MMPVARQQRFVWREEQHPVHFYHDHHDHHDHNDNHRHHHDHHKIIMIIKNCHEK